MDADRTHPDGVAFVEGAYVPIAEARIPILDRGFVRSDATYDVAHVWRGRFFRLDDHLGRFEANVEALRMTLPHSCAEIVEILMGCVRRSGLRDAYVQMTCTRGLPNPGSRDPRLSVNRFYAFAVPFIWIAPEESRRRGVKLLISARERIPPATLDPRIKNFQWLDMTMAMYEAYELGAELPVLIDRDGNLTEGPGFNVFVLQGGRLATPASGVFEGMTRRTVFELCAETNVECEARDVPAGDLAGADEVFLSSTAGGIIGVSAVNGGTLGDGAPGPLTTRLHDLYWSKKEAGWLGTPVDYGA
ncbi:MAG: aminotransferase class IV [Rhodospirillales bacterium]|jgi:branched-chain amino acid aminotransferase|nr:aminotransferase class IV [Rhodospirillales bacterium]